MKQSVNLILLALVLLCAYCAKAQDEEATNPGSDAESTANFPYENGTNQVEIKRAGRFVGGVQSAIANYPYVVTVIVIDGTAFISYRAGAIISDTQVLTAASSVSNFIAGIASITIRAGSVYKDQGGFTFSVSKKEINPLYDGTTKENDVAVLTITGSFSGIANVAPITVATNEIPFSTTNPTTCVFLGWGSDPAFNELTIMSRADYNLASDATCTAKFGGIMPASLQCAASVSGYVCYDSMGFPLVCNNQLYGINPGTDVCKAGALKFAKLPAASIQSFLVSTRPVAASQPAPRKNYVSCP